MPPSDEAKLGRGGGGAGRLLLGKCPGKELEQGEWLTQV